MKTRRDRYSAINRRRKRIKWFKRLRLLALFVLIYLVASGFIRAYNSSYFNVKKINVVGNCQLSDASVKKLSEVTISKDSLLKLSTTEIKERLLKNPWVEDAQVIRDFPSTLKIKVREREPVVYISFKGKLFLIDKNLFVLSSSDSSDTLDIPRVEDLKIADIKGPKDLKVGKKISSKILSNAVTCLINLDPSLRTGIDFISAASIDRISFFTQDNIEILYGEAEDIERKNHVLKEILSENREKIIFIDVRQVMRPVVRHFEKPSQNQ